MVMPYLSRSFWFFRGKLFEGGAPCQWLTLGAAIWSDEADANGYFCQNLRSAQDPLCHPHAGGAQFGGAALDDQRIVEFRRAEEADMRFGDGVGTLASLVRGALVDAELAEDFAPCPFAEFEVIGVINDARQIGVLIVNADREQVARPVETAGGRGQVGWHLCRVNYGNVDGL